MVYGRVLARAGALYEAFSRGEPSPLPELPIQYADYALWQRQWLRGEVLDEQLGYWKEPVLASHRPPPPGSADTGVPADRSCCPSR